MSDQPIGFPTTNWSAVHAAATDREPLSRLLERYWRPLVVHLVIDRRLQQNDAEDLVQSFIASKVIGGDLLATADAGKGRFRSLVLTALDRFVIDELRKRKAQKRAPDRAESLDAAISADTRGVPPHAAFEVAWALEVVSGVFAKMREECSANGRPYLWAAFEARSVRPLAGQPPVAYEELAGKLGFRHPKQAANAYATAQRMFVRLLGRWLAAEGESQVDDSVGDLLRILSAAGKELQERLRIFCAEQLPDVTTAADLTEFVPLAALFRMAPNASDLAACWRELTESDLLFDLGDASPELSSRIAHDGLAPRSLGELVRRRGPTLDLLELAKQFAKSNRGNPDSPLPVEVSTALYYVAIAAALVAHGELITDLAHDSLRSGFEWLASQSWTDAASLALARQGRERLLAESESAG